MLFSFLYMILRGMFRLAASGDQREREIEILVLRHQIKVLGRKAGRPKLKRLDRVVLAAAGRGLPAERRLSFHSPPSVLRRTYTPCPWPIPLSRPRATSRKSRSTRCAGRSPTLPLSC